MARGPFGRKRPFVEPEIEIVFSVDVNRDFSSRTGVPQKNKITMAEKSIKSTASKGLKRKRISMGGIDVNMNLDDSEILVSGGRTNIPRDVLNDGIDIIGRAIEDSGMDVRGIKISVS